MLPTSALSSSKVAVWVLERLSEQVENSKLGPPGSFPAAATDSLTFNSIYLLGSM